MLRISGSRGGRLGHVLSEGGWSSPGVLEYPGPKVHEGVHPHELLQELERDANEEQQPLMPSHATASFYRKEYLRGRIV